MFADFYGVHISNHDQFGAIKKMSLNMALKKLCAQHYIVFHYTDMINAKNLKSIDNDKM